MFRIFAAAGVIVAVMATVKDGRVLHESGLTGSCRVVQTVVVDGSSWVGCTSGRLEGRPDLSRLSCTRWGVRAKLEYWHCPAGFDKSAIRG